MKPIKIYNDSNRFTVDWTINTLCTYKCSYCHPSLHSGKNVFKDKETDKKTVLQFLTRLRDQIKGRPVHMWIGGGEPTISPVFETIIDFLDENGWHMHLNTNCTRSMDWWEEYAKKIYKVTVSYHPEGTDTLIFDKVEYISSQTNIGVFTLMYPPLWDNAVSAYYRFKNMERVTIAPSRVFRREIIGNNDISYDYTEEQLQWLQDHSEVIFRDGVKPENPNNRYGTTFVEYNDGTVKPLDEVEFTNSRKNKFAGWDCTMGVNHLFINKDWDIAESACTTAKFFSNVATFTELPKKNVICASEYCMCTADVMIPKQKHDSLFNKVY